MTTERVHPADVYPQIIGLKFAISELLQELAVDTIQDHPRTVLLALRGLLMDAEAITDGILGNAPPAAVEPDKTDDLVSRVTASTNVVVIPDEVLEVIRGDGVAIMTWPSSVDVKCTDHQQVQLLSCWLKRLRGKS